MFGYMNKMALIDLTSLTVENYQVSENDYRLFLGGKSLAAKIIYDNIKQKIDPFSLENLIVITTSPLTATTAPCSSRFNVSTISPLTGLLTSSNCGGPFGIQLKKSGFDGLVITGKAKQPTFIDITDDSITFKDAKHLWGKKTGETEQLIGGRANGKFVIGPAGENLVLYAGVFSNERAAGRGGVGAVFGSKNLKGLVASGTKQIDFYNKEKFKKLNKKWISILKQHPLTGGQLPNYGTAGLVTPMNYRNLLATKNYNSGSFDRFEDISGETLTEKHLIKNKGCVSCPIQCARVVSVDGKQVKGPEVETIALFGSNLLNSDMQKILDINHLADELGLDTISMGSTIGFAMELNEKGVWNSGLNFGDMTNIEKTIEDIAFRRGIGDLLADGTKRLAEKFGGKEYAINVKGMELAAYEPRAAQGMGLGYATANRGGCHLNGGYMVVLEGLGLDISGKTTKGKAEFSIFFQDLMEAVSAGGSCLFTTYAILPGFLIANPNSFVSKTVNKLAPYFGGIIGFVHRFTSLLSVNVPFMVPHSVMINYVTGMKLNIGSLKKTGERGYTLERLVNLRLGMTNEEDRLPKRLLKQLQRKDDSDSVVKLQEMLPIYYKTRGWDQNGVPTQKSLKKLGLL